MKIKYAAKFKKSVGSRNELNRVFFQNNYFQGQLYGQTLKKTKTKNNSIS